MSCTFGILTLKGVLALLIYACIFGFVLGLAESITKDWLKRRGERQ